MESAARHNLPRKHSICRGTNLVTNATVVQQRICDFRYHLHRTGQFPGRPGNNEPGCILDSTPGRPCLSDLGSYVMGISGSSRCNRQRPTRQCSDHVQDTTSMVVVSPVLPVLELWLRGHLYA